MRFIARAWLHFTLVILASACASYPPSDFRHYDVLAPSAPPLHRIADTQLSDADYARLWRWGEQWFRGATFGNERTLTDVVGILSGSVQVPCTQPGVVNCYTDAPVLPFYAAAIDALDGVSDNLYTGNGGPDGNGYTHDLVLHFPPGTKLYGFDVPEQLHTGLDVEAGSAWPIGIVPVPVADSEPDQPYFIHAAQLGAGPAPNQPKQRLGMTCALCHYSLDVDWDGKTDLHSAQLEHPTPGSPYRPQDAWPIGNQDLHIGWLFALTPNPLLSFAVFSGPLGHGRPQDARAWVNWLHEHYVSSPGTVMHEVVRGMLVQPRGFADVSPNARHDAEQIPTLLTRGNWPSNYDGVFVNASDRNNTIWTTALDLTSVVALASDRTGAAQGILYWEPVGAFHDLTAQQLADMLLRYSPLVRADPSQRQRLIDDVLGVSDGVPGRLSVDSVVVMPGIGGALPDQILHHPDNVRAGRIRAPASYGADAQLRAPLMALTGVRIRTPIEMRQAVDASALAKRYPKLNIDDLANDAVSLMLDANESPPNLSPLLRNAAGWVARGYGVFRDAGCVSCHAGPALVDNLVHPNSLRRLDAKGLVDAPSTAGWRRTESVRVAGPAIGSEPTRAESTRPVRLYVAPAYDPRTGKAVAAGGPLTGFFGERVVGYKTSQLRYLWGSAPYLHDGGVGVSLRPGSAPAGEDLQQLLRRPSADKWYGMGRILAERERDPDGHVRADAALSLQALLLQSERARVLAANRERVYPAPLGPQSPNVFGEPAYENLSMQELGIVGVGHEFWIDDVPGGDKITALVAFLLALDDKPAEIARAAQ